MNAGKKQQILDAIKTAHQLVASEPVTGEDPVPVQLPGGGFGMFNRVYASQAAPITADEERGFIRRNAEMAEAPAEDAPQRATRFATLEDIRELQARIDGCVKEIARLQRAYLKGGPLI